MPLRAEHRRRVCGSRRFTTGAARYAVLAAICGALWGGGSRAVADTVTLSPVLDNTLYEDSEGATSNGAGDHLFAGRTALVLARRALLEFDLASAIPAGSTLLDVHLTLNMSQTIAGTQTVGMHRVLTAWGEGTSNALGNEGQGTTAAPGDATWLHGAYPSSLWNQAGGDYVAAASASLPVAGFGFYTWPSTSQLVADAQEMLDTPSANHGWILIGAEDSDTTTKRFDSREHPTATFRPALTVEFAPPVMPSGGVPDGNTLAGQPLKVGSTESADVDLSWGASCLSSDFDYAIYEGPIGEWYAHFAAMCSTGGSLTATISPTFDAAYFLVVPRNSFNEGSYGFDSLGDERPQGNPGCRRRAIAPCP